MYISMANQTIQELNGNATTKANEQDSKKGWAKVSEVVPKYFGKTKLYELIKSNKIKSCSLRERGMIRGTRLICLDSLEAYFNDLAEQQMAELNQEGE